MPTFAVQLDLFLPAPVQAGVAGAHHAVTAPGASHPVRGTPSVSVRPSTPITRNLLAKPSGIWRGHDPRLGSAMLLGVSEFSATAERRA